MEVKTFLMPCTHIYTLPYIHSYVVLLYPVSVQFGKFKVTDEYINGEFGIREARRKYLQSSSPLKIVLRNGFSKKLNATAASGVFLAPSTERRLLDKPACDVFYGLSVTKCAEIIESGLLLSCPDTLTGKKLTVGHLLDLKTDAVDRSRNYKTKLDRKKYQ